jgi:hypothetical protein
VCNLKNTRKMGGTPIQSARSLESTMKRVMLSLAVLLALTMPALAQPAAEQLGPNLAMNPGFEQLTDGQPAPWRLPAGYGVDATVAHSGARSLRYHNDDPSRYLLASQPLKIEPGARYEVHAWVRAKGVTGDDSGATVCLEWQDAQGRWLGGYYPDGRKDTGGQWEEVGGVSPRVPEGAASGSVTCYLRKGMTGTAWWDDVSVQRYRVPPMRAFLDQPGYRGWILDDGPASAAVRVSFDWRDVDYTAQDMVLQMSLGEAGGKVLAQKAFGDLTSTETHCALPLPKLEPGAYKLSLSLVRTATGQAVQTLTWPLERHTGPMPRCYIDGHQRLIVDGKPFFPLGMYWSNITEDELKLYAGGPFNCLIPYGGPTRAQMDLAQKYGLKVIYSVKDDYFGTQWSPKSIRSEADEKPTILAKVNEFREHPALLAWYLNDELPASMAERLDAHRDWVHAADPDHPTWVVVYQVDEVADYARSFDAIGTDPYPIPGRPAAMAGEWARKTRLAVDGMRPLWMVPQVFDKAVYEHPAAERPKAQPPTYDEMRSMAWQCITEGANGLIFYSWFDLWRDAAFPFDQRWPEVKRIAEEIQHWTPVLLSVEKTPLIDVGARGSVHWTARKAGRKVYVFLVNDSPQAASYSVATKGGPTPVRLEGQVLAPDGGGAYTVPMPPLGTRVLEFGE